MYSNMIIYDCNVQIFEFWVAGRVMRKGDKTIYRHKHLFAFAVELWYDEW